jgi:hypothetical protein
MQLEALQKFNRNVDAFHAKLQKGFTVLIWESTDMDHKIEVKMRLSANNKIIHFEEPKSRRKSFLPAAAVAFFSSKISVAPIHVVDIFEALPGGDTSVLRDMTERDMDSLEQTLLTLVSKSEGSRPRTILVKVASKEERNNIVSGLRMMLTSINSPVTERNILLDNRVDHPPMPPTINEDTATTPETHITEVSLSSEGGSVDGNSAGQRRGSGSSKSVPKTPGSAQRVMRRMSKRDEILANSKRASIANTNLANAMSRERRSSSTGKAIANPLSDSADGGGNVDKARMQNLTLINELNERNVEIQAMKKREQVYEQTLKAKEKMYEQDANVRMQLGRRLEQILLDKEEAKGEIDELKAHIIHLESLMATGDGA